MFEARSAEARQLRYPGRNWPPTVVAYDHWVDDYRRAAESAGLDLTVEEAVDIINNWIAEIDTASPDVSDLS